MSARFETLETRALLSAITPGPQFALGGESSYGSDTAADAQGNLVTVWTDSASGSLKVYARRFDKDGNALGAPVLVNQTVGAYVKRNPNVAVAADGRFVVAWSTEIPGAHEHSDLSVRRFNAAGQPQGSEIVTTANGPFNASARVAMDDLGEFALVWKNERSGNNYDIDVQRFDAAGKKLGRQLTANASAIAYGTLGYFGPGGSIDMDADGDFVVTWNAPGRDGSGWGVFGQRFAKDGSKAGGEFRANTYTAGDQAGWDNVSLGVGGDFLVTWESWGQNGQGTGVYAQRYSAAGAPVGGEFQVNDPALGDQSSAHPDVGRDGYFAVGFSGGAQAYAPDGSPIGGNLPGGGLPVMQPNHEFLVAWGSGGQKFFIDMSAPTSGAASAGVVAHESITDAVLISA
jgi:hypothetical protein